MNSARQQSREGSQILTKVIVPPAAIVCTLLILEILLRLFGYEGDHRRLNVIFDDFYGDMDANLVAFLDTKNEDRKTVRVVEGMYTVEKPPDTLRVLFVGDSGTVGSGVDLTQAFPHLVGQWINERGVKAEAINTGMGGMSTVSEYNFLSRELLALNPDIVVLAIFMANDINFNVMHKQTLLGYGGWEKHVQRLRTQSALVDFLYLRFQILNSRYELTSRDVHPGERLAFDQVDENGLNFLNYGEGELALYVNPPSKLAIYAFTVLEELLLRFRDLATQHRFQLVVTLVPTRSASAGEYALTDITREGAELLGFPVDTLDLDQPRRKIMEICDRHHLRCIDPTPVWKHVERTTIPPGDDHPTECGHGAIASALVTHFDIAKKRFVDLPFPGMAGGSCDTSCAAGLRCDKNICVPDSNFCETFPATRGLPGLPCYGELSRVCFEPAECRDKTCVVSTP